MIVISTPLFLLLLLVWWSHARDKEIAKHEENARRVESQYPFNLTASATTFLSTADQRKADRATERAERKARMAAERAERKVVWTPLPKAAKRKVVWTFPTQAKS